MEDHRAEYLVEQYSDMILRLGFSWLGDMDDAMDICQEVLLKLLTDQRTFPDQGQERAWVVRLTINQCKNWKKSAWFRHRAPLEEGLHLAVEAPELEDGSLLEQIRLTKESKAALIQALKTKQAPHASRSPRRWNRLTLIAAAMAAVLVISAGAAMVASPVVRSYFGNSIGYQQSAVELGESITKNGWTMTLTDCAADDYTVYVGVTLTGPEGTVLDNEKGYLFEDWFSPRFPELDVAGSGGYMQVKDENPTDNQVSFIFTTNLYYNDGNQPLNGQLMELTLGKLYHTTVWNETEERWERAYDCEEDWTFRTTLNYSDHIIRLEPNLPVHTLDVDATITQVVVSPLTVYVQIESDALKGHHDWVPKTAPDGWYSCVEYQEVTLYTKDGTTIPMTDGTAGSGCSGGTDPTEDGWIRLVRRPDTPLDIETLTAISICGVRIDL